MSSGIYAMYFDNVPDRFYVGYSIHLEQRKKQHYARLKSFSHTNLKLLQAYKDCLSLPIFEIIETLPADPIVLGKREKFWVEQFDAYTEGFNNSKGGEGGGFGDSHYNALYTEQVYIDIGNALVDYPEISVVDIARELEVSVDVVYTIANSVAHTYLEEKIPNFREKLALRGTTAQYHARKHTKETYISIFNYLVYTNDKLHTIASKHVVSQTVVEEISAGTTHLWLKTEYPEQWQILMDKKKTRRGQPQGGGSYPDVKDPEGNVYSIAYNAKAFALSKSLHPGHFGDLLRKKIKQHKGWTLA